MSYESLSVLRQKYCCPMIFGVAMDSNKLNNVNFKKIIPYVFDSITCENDMKPNYMSGDTEALPYNYTKADATVSFAKNYNMKIVGHVLWYDPANNPKFVTASVRPTGMSNIVENHIRNVITHFDTIAPNMVYAWQVTNEALSDDGTIQTDQLIQQKLGDNFFRYIYQYTQNLVSARSATNPIGINKPNIKLFYNDYRNLATDGIFNRLQSLKNAGLLDGIGIQCHGTSIATLSTMTEKYIQAGFEVHYTEVDNNSSSILNDSNLTLWYRQVIQIALKYGVRNFTVWGLTDDKSWLYMKNSQGVLYTSLNPRQVSPRYPLLFDSNYKPKPCYTALIEELKKFGDQAYDVIIILGQSNSAGNGGGIYTFKTEGVSGRYDMRSKNLYDDDFANKFNENIRQLSYDNRIVPAFERLENQADSGSRFTYGFGVSFARQYIREGKLAAGRKILLINCGVGGTGFFACYPPSPVRGIWDMDDTTCSINLYKGALNRIKTALNSIKSSSQVKAILWHQGEADIPTIFGNLGSPTSNTVRTLKTNEYTRMLISMLNALRTNIGCPSVPILFGGLSPSYYIRQILGIDSAKNDIVVDKNDMRHKWMSDLIKKIASDNSSSNYKFVSAEPISSVPDFNHYLQGNSLIDAIHFNKSSQIELGKRYFYVFNNNHINNDRPFT